MHEQDREGGFTLIEVLIAVVILVFGLLAVMNLMVVAVSSTMAANFSTITTAAATEQMERLEDLTTIAGGPAIGTGGSLDSDQAGFFRVDTSSNAVIRTRWLVTQVSASPTTYHIQVRSEAEGPLLGPRTRAEFTTFRIQSPAE